MTLAPDTRARIEALLAQHPVLLFMKGSPRQPQCGFSAKAVGILNGLLPSFGHVDVLQDPELREGIKAFGQWPTIPQLYIRGELVGGSDIVSDLADSGELQALLGLPAPDRTPPQVRISDAAATAIRGALDSAPDGAVLHLQVDERFNAQFQLKPARGNEIVAESAGIRLHFDPASASRSQGLSIDWIDDARGQGLAIDNPNAPAPVQRASVEEVQAQLGQWTIIDVRPAFARQHAPFPHPHEVLDEDSKDRLAALPKDTVLAFLCHHGNSSRQAAEHFRQLGFTRVVNIEGGIDAWAERLDPSITRY